MVQPSSSQTSDVASKSVQSRVTVVSSLGGNQRFGMEKVMLPAEAEEARKTVVRAASAVRVMGLFFQVNYNSNYLNRLV